MIPALFVEMFGDPATNPRGWDIVLLGSIGVVQGGLQVTVKRADNPIKVPYLRVANVYRDKLILEEIKFIRVTEKELNRVALSLGDILIVEGHGNPEETGRCSVWDGSIYPCVHQNHLIRVRVNKLLGEPIFISAYLNSHGGRLHLLRSGKTTSGLNTISTSNVKATEVILPPLTLQRAFVERIADIHALSDQQERQLTKADELMNALMARFFGNGAGLEAAA